MTSEAPCEHSAEAHSAAGCGNAAAFPLPATLSSDPGMTEWVWQHEGLARLLTIVEKINRGLRLEQILDEIYDNFRDIIPYTRIAFASLEPQTGRIVARWSRSDYLQRLTSGYDAPINETSLLEIARSGRPRIINDLATHVQNRPESEASRLLIEENVRSSLTCPLIVDGRTVGFLFFDSDRPAAYHDVHVTFFMQMAGVISVGLERALMITELQEQNCRIEEQNRLLADAQQRTQQELEMARRVQSALIPGDLPDCPLLATAMHYEPAEMIGGDLLDCIRLSDGRVIILVADAMGHGVAAALLMSVVGTAFRGALSQARSNGSPVRPAEIIRYLNNTIIELFETYYVTAACALLDLAGHKITLSQAGHPPPLLLRSKKHETEALEMRGIPLGIYSTAAYQNLTVDFHPGDLLLLYTDGLIEAVDPHGRRYGLDMLKQHVQSNGKLSAKEMIAQLHADMTRHCKGQLLEDDLTMMVAQFKQ